MKLNPHHDYQPSNIDASASSTHSHLTRDTSDSSTLAPSEALDRLITSDISRGHFATAELDPSTLGTLLSTITPKPITWLWPGRIPCGTLTFLDGDPGVGTSLLALTLAACVSSGTPLPDQTPLTQGKVLLLSPHADPASMLAPRLSAAGADFSRILLLNTLPLNPIADIPSSTFTTRPFVLPRDLSALQSVIQHQQASLVILDHLSAFMPPVPLSQLARPHLPITDPCAADAPDLFTALAHIASATGCAILLVRHTSRGRPLSERHGTAPVHLLLLPDPRAQDQRLLCTLKNTLSAPAPNQTYQIMSTHHTGHTNSTGNADHTAQAVPRLHWLTTNPAPTLALAQAAYSSLPPNRQAILHTLAQAPGPLGPQDIAAQTGLSYDLVRLLLSRMSEAHEIARVSYGIYTSLGHSCLASLPPKTESSWMPDSLNLDLPFPGLTPTQNQVFPSNAISSAPTGAPVPLDSVSQSPSSAISPFPQAFDHPIPPCSPAPVDAPVPLDSVSQSPSPTISPFPHPIDHLVPPHPFDAPISPDPLALSDEAPRPLPSSLPALPHTFSDPPESFPSPTHLPGKA